MDRSNNLTLHLTLVLPSNVGKEKQILKKSNVCDTGNNHLANRKRRIGNKEHTKDCEQEFSLGEVR